MFSLGAIKVMYKSGAGTASRHSELMAGTFEYQLDEGGFSGVIATMLYEYILHNNYSHVRDLVSDLKQLEEAIKNDE